MNDDIEVEFEKEKFVDVSVEFFEMDMLKNFLGWGVWVSDKRVLKWMKDVEKKVKIECVKVLKSCCDVKFKYVVISEKYDKKVV